MKNILLTLLFVAQSLIDVPPASESPVEFEFKASPRINFNLEQARKEGLHPMDFTNQVKAFFEAREQFTLDELKSLEIAIRDGKTIKLSQVASIEVSFCKAPQTTPAEQVGAGQPATRPEPKSEHNDKSQSEGEGCSR